MLARPRLVIRHKVGGRSLTGRQGGLGNRVWASVESAGPTTRFCTIPVC
jgi:hypothetical protein